MEPDFTIEQFKAWVEETFPDNRARAIEEYNFRDGLAKLADFVFQTNSTAFVQASLEELTQLKSTASEYAAAALESKGQAEVILTLAIQAKIDAQLAKTQSETALNNINLGLIPKGSYNVTTNTPAITATPNPAWVDGSYLDISPNSGALTFAGENFSIGQAVNPGDRLKKIGNQWSYIKDASLALKEVLDLKPVVQNLGFTLVYRVGQGMYITDAIGRVAQKIDATGATQIMKFLSKSIKVDALEDGALTTSKMSTDFYNDLGVAPKNMPYLWAILDKSNPRRSAIHVTSEGHTMIGYLMAESIRAGTISFDKLDEFLKDKINTAGFEKPESGDIFFSIRDTINRYSFAAFRNGEIFANLKAFSVLEKSMHYSIQKQILPNVSDQVQVADDSLRRGNQIVVKADTSQFGSLWKRLPSFQTPIVELLNNSGTALQIRKAPRIVIRGEKYVGTFSPDYTDPELILIGLVSAGYALPTGRIAGDYVSVISESSASMVIGGFTVVRGDSIVSQGNNTWIKKAAPTGTESSEPGYWWNVLTPGKFQGVEYVAGDRIYHISKQSTGGSGRAHTFTKQKYGEYFYCGDLNLAAPTFNANPKNFDIYTTNTGVYNSENYLEGDYMVRKAGAYYKFSVTSDTVPINGLRYLECANSSIFEVRRADKSVTKALFDIEIRQTFAERRTKFPIIRLVGNSHAGLMAQDNIFNVLIAKQGRYAQRYSYGGGKSYEISSMLEKFIKEGDALRGDSYFFINDSNNIGDLPQIFRENQKCIELIGASNPKYCFMTCPPGRVMTFNGTKLVFFLHANAYYMEEWYKTAYPYNHFQTRYALLEASKLRTTPDLQNPGFTEGQMAISDGLSAFSYAINYGTTDVPFTAEQLAPNFKGYINDLTTMPTGGSDNDYWLRGGAGDDTKVGNILAKINGVWTEYGYDRAHLNVLGANVVGQALYDQKIIRDNF